MADPALWRRTLEVNLFGAYHTAQAAVPHLRQRGAGAIILVGSGPRLRPAPGFSAYACSKIGLWMLAQSLAPELQDSRISVNELLPGPVRPDMPRGVAMPPGEWVKEAEDVVPLALFLATQTAGGPSGQSFSLMRRA